MTYTFKEIVDYILNSPKNVNPAILKQMILNITWETPDLKPTSELPGGDDTLPSNPRPRI